MKHYLSISVVRWAQNALAITAGALVAHLAQAAELTHYGLGKYQGYQQTGRVPLNPLVPDSFSFQAFIYQAEANAILFATVSGSSGSPAVVGNTSEDPLLLTSSEGFSSQSELDLARPNGTYAFEFFTSTGAQINASLALNGDAYPTAPALDNFLLAQDIDRTKAFVLQWTKPPQLDATDYVAVSVWADGELIFSTPMPWQPGALVGNTTSVSLPANTLPTPADLTGQIQFFNVTARNTQGIAGATGLAHYVASTTFPLKLHTSGGGGGDNPTLSTVQPTSGANGVAAASPVVFAFSEAMRAQQQINWFGPPNAASFVYSWSADGRTLTCTYPGGFPVQTVITWQLVEAGFADLAGNALTGENLAGFFTTASGGPTRPCENGLENQVNSFVVGRLASFSQLSAAAPMPETNLQGDNAPATFLASFSPSGLTISQAELVIPGGQRKALTFQFGHYFLFQSFPSEGAMLTSYPNGGYTGEITLSGGGKSSQSVTLGNGPNTPRCSNFDPAQVINPAAAFLLSWDALTGVTANDRIEIVIFDPNGLEILRLPDECSTPPKPLAPTATSISIPANLLQLATTYPVELTFTRVSEVKSNASPAYVTMGAYLKTTRFNIKTIGGTANTRPVITAYRIAGDGKFEAEVTGTVARTIKLEASDLSTPWTSVGSAVVPASGKVTVRDSSAATLKAQAYRAKSE